MRLMDEAMIIPEIQEDTRKPYAVIAPEPICVTQAAMMFENLVNFYLKHDLPFTEEGRPDLSHILLDEKQKEAFLKAGHGFRLELLVLDKAQSAVQVPAQQYEQPSYPTQL